LHGKHFVRCKRAHTTEIGYTVNARSDPRWDRTTGPAEKKLHVTAIIVAAGRGERAGSAAPKQYRQLAGEPVLRRSLRLFAAHPEVQTVQPVIDLDHAEHFRQASQGLERLRVAVAGGNTRQASVLAGLIAIESAVPDIVLVHDAARPFASRELVDRALAAVRVTGAAVPALPVRDTIKSVGTDGIVKETLDRSGLRAIQTPQAFAFDPLLAAHRRAMEAGRNDFPDDASLVEWAGLKVITFPGDANNLKLTDANDFERAFAMAAATLDVRTGTGFDVHRFGPGDHVVLGGIKIPHVNGLIGHSDSDVLLHAVTDAILGAIAEGDIGRHFPPSDPQWRGASSDRFLAHAVSLVRARQGKIAHIDATILCEAPKIAPHAESMRGRIAAVAGIDIAGVSVKATTTEGLGFLGRGEGIAAMATATVRLPWSEA
jgi:2-C-methyl-D-erythritol 4-phosphate cytidylyltransferase / 2-C-methyl-D-erythritol 2,4-cyclodiphosphate synthase